MTAAPEPGEEHILCYLDLDQFKIINDTCGHIAGDELLRQISALLQGKIRSRDTLARIGGDEFALLMEYCSLDRAMYFTEKIRAAIEEFQFHWRSSRFSLGISIGILKLQKNTSVVDTITLADTACYVAKNHGGNRIHIYCKDDTAVSD